MAEGLLEFGKAEIIAFALVLATTLLWAIFFGLTGITANDFFTLKLHIVFEKVLTLNTLAFLLLLPLPIAITAVMAKRAEKMPLIIATTTASLIALAIAMAIFETIQGLWIVAVFYIISLPFAVETATMKYQELQKWVPIRVALSSMARVITIVSIGLVALSIMTVVPQQEQYVQKFEGFIIDFATGLSSGESQQTISSGAADLIAESQIETVNSMVDNIAFQKLKTKTDPDVIAFVAIADSMAGYIRSPEYKQELERQFSEASSGVIEKLDIMGVIRQQFPFINTIEQFLWAIYALTIVGVFSLAASIICKPMASLYAIIAEKAFSLTEPEEPAEKAEELEKEFDSPQYRRRTQPAEKE